MRRRRPTSELIERFDLKSPTDASNMLLSGKRIFKSHLTKVIKEYAGQDAATAAEIRRWRILSRAWPDEIF